MAFTAGEGIIDLKLGTSGLRHGYAAASRAVRGMVSGLGKIAKIPFSFTGLVAGGIGMAALVKGMKDATDAAREQRDAERRRNAVLEATGYAAGFTAKQLNEQAAALQQATDYGDEYTIALQGVLATFKDIKGDAFRETTELAMDMATVLGTDAKQAALQLGKALNDPAKQASALRRSGVSLTEQQMEQIRAFEEAGEKAKAQAVILKELRTEFGGAARAAADPWTQMSNLIGDLYETVGEQLLPTIDALAKTFIGQGNDMADIAEKLGEKLSDATDYAVELGVKGATFAEMFYDAWKSGRVTFYDIVKDMAKYMQDAFASAADGIAATFHYMWTEIGQDAARNAALDLTLVLARGATKAGLVPGVDSSAAGAIRRGPAESGGLDMDRIRGFFRAPEAPNFVDNVMGGGGGLDFGEKVQSRLKKYRDALTTQPAKGPPPKPPTPDEEDEAGGGKKGKSGGTASLKDALAAIQDAALGMRAEKLQQEQLETQKKLLDETRRGNAERTSGMDRKPKGKVLA